MFMQQSHCTSDERIYAWFSWRMWLVVESIYFQSITSLNKLSDFSCINSALKVFECRRGLSRWTCPIVKNGWKTVKNLQVEVSIMNRHESSLEYGSSSMPCLSKYRLSCNFKSEIRSNCSHINLTSKTSSSPIPENSKIRHRRASRRMMEN